MASKSRPAGMRPSSTPSGGMDIGWQRRYRLNGSGPCLNTAGLRPLVSMSSALPLCSNLVAKAGGLGKRRR